MATFTYTPSLSAKESRKPRIIVAQFGDGYSQRVRDGLNNDMAVWDLAFNNQTTANATSIETFFATQGGTTVFDWTPPNSASSKKFICREWTRTEVSYNVVSITAKFEQVPA